MPYAPVHLLGAEKQIFSLQKLYSPNPPSTFFFLIFVIVCVLIAGLPLRWTHFTKPLDLLLSVLIRETEPLDQRIPCVGHCSTQTE